MERARKARCPTWRRTTEALPMVHSMQTRPLRPPEAPGSQRRPKKGQRRPKSRPSILGHRGGGGRSRCHGVALGCPCGRGASLAAASRRETQQFPLLRLAAVVARSTTRTSLSQKMSTDDKALTRRSAFSPSTIPPFPASLSSFALDHPRVSIQTLPRSRSRRQSRLHPAELCNKA